MKKILLFVFGFLAIVQLQAHNGVAFNTTGSSPDASAIIDASSTSQGILIPRMTMAQRDAISSPVIGLMIYQNDNTPGFYHYDGTNWVSNGSTTVIGIDDLTDGKVVGTSYFIGLNAGNSTTGAGNIGIGAGTLYSLTTGTQNVAIGSSAGNTATGSDNILIGYGTNPSANTASNELNIGKAIYATGLNGNSAKVGIGNGNNAPTSTLSVNGSMSLPIDFKNVNYTLTDNDYTIVATGTTTITLPDPSTIEGRVYIIKVGNSGTIAIDSDGSGTIDGSSSVTLSTANDYITVQSAGGTYWIIIGKN